MYTQQELDRILAQRKKRWPSAGHSRSYIGCLSRLFPGHPRGVAHHVDQLSIAGGLLIFIYDLALKPLSCYVRHLQGVLQGRTRTLEGTFKRVDMQPSMVDGVAYRGVIVSAGDPADEEDDRLFYSMIWESLSRPSRRARRLAASPITIVRWRSWKSYNVCIKRCCMETVLVCVTGQRMCERLIHRGTQACAGTSSAFVGTFGGRQWPERSNERCRGRSLWTHLYQASAASGAEMTVLCSDKPLDAIIDFAKEHGARHLVLGEGKPDVHGNSFASRLATALPLVVFHGEPSV